AACAALSSPLPRRHDRPSPFAARLRLGSRPPGAAGSRRFGALVPPRAQRPHPPAPLGGRGGRAPADPLRIAGPLRCFPLPALLSRPPPPRRPRRRAGRALHRAGAASSAALGDL